MRSDLREDVMHTSIARTSVAHTSPRPLRWTWLWLLCLCSSVSAQSAAPVPSLSKPDTVWVLVSACLVIFMTLPGLALFYGGLVRSKNVLSILMQTLTVFAVVAILWALYGYSLAFTEGNAFIGGLDRCLLYTSRCV